MFAIGAYPDVGIKEARKNADEALELAKQGINPAHQRKAEKVPSGYGGGGDVQGVC